MISPSMIKLTPEIEELNVTPSKTAQTIEVTAGIDGYGPINVAAVTSSIDSNISAGNIKKDVTILGVIGTYEGSGGGISGYAPDTIAYIGTGVLTKQGNSVVNVLMHKVEQV